MVSVPQLEEWRLIEEPELDKYYVSNLGNVRRQSREFKNKWINIKGSSLKGYRYFQQMIDGKRKNHLIHRCVAKAFIENPDNKPCVDHIDNDRANNNVTNLRWCFHSENCKNQPQTIEGKKNGVVFDKKRQRWISSARENNKGKFLGYYDTYEEAKKAREHFEGSNEFYKQGKDDNFSSVKGKELTRRQRGSGTITQRDNGRWRTVLIKLGIKIFDKTFATYNEAEEYRKKEVEKLRI